MTEFGTLSYFDLSSLGVNGRGGVIPLFLKCAGTEMAEKRFPFSEWAEKKQELISSGRNPAGHVPVVDLPDGGVLTESHAILRRFARTLGLYGSDLEADYVADVLADNVVPLRDAWAASLFTDEQGKAAYKEARKAHYAVLEALAAKYGLPGDQARPLSYADALLWAVLWDDSRLYGSDALDASPTLTAVFKALKDKYPPLAAFAAANATPAAEPAAADEAKAPAAAAGGEEVVVAAKTE